ESDEILVTPGINEGFSACIVLEVRFKCLYMTGIGIPDLGFISYNNMYEYAKMIANLNTSIPFMVDNDMGYSSPNMVARTVA
ncbi:hypothetical protein BKA59DRAFT_401350, partial [Fusarium tricinctum]